MTASAFELHRAVRACAWPTARRAPWSIASVIRSSTAARRLAALIAIAVGQHRPFGRQRRRAGQIGHRRQLLLDEDRRHALGDGDQPLRPAGRAGACRAPSRRSCPRGISNSPAWIGSHEPKILRHRAIGRRGAGNRRPARPAASATVARLEPSSTMTRVRPGLGPGASPQQPEGRRRRPAGRAATTHEDQPAQHALGLVDRLHRPGWRWCRRSRSCC